MWFGQPKSLSMCPISREDHKKGGEERELAKTECCKSRAHRFRFFFFYLNTHRAEKTTWQKNSVPEWNVPAHNGLFSFRPYFTKAFLTLLMHFRPLCANSISMPVCVKILFRPLLYLEPRVLALVAAFQQLAVYKKRCSSKIWRLSWSHWFLQEATASHLPMERVKSFLGEEKWPTCSSASPRLASFVIKERGEEAWQASSSELLLKRIGDISSWSNRVPSSPLLLPYRA